MNKKNKKVIIFAGCSGSGKTFMVQLLSERYPDKFNNLKQVTTREMRPGEYQGNPYKFISKEEYDEMSDNLVGKTEINGEFYGTIFDCDPDKYNTIILNKLGIENFKKDFPLDECGIDYIVVMIESRKPVKRKNRSEEYLMEERWNIMEEMNMCFVHNPPEYKSVDEIYNKIDDFFSRYFKTI